MSAPATTTPAWQWPADVLEFAAKEKVQAYLDPLLDATRRVFPTARQMKVSLECDPEIANDWHIVFDVEVPQRDVPNFVEAMHQWNREAFAICPAPPHLYFPVVPATDFLMNPRDFLDVADNLVTGLTEAEWRSAASRAYYAAFHTVRLLLQQCGFEVPRADQAHSYLWLRLANSGQPDLQGAGNDLNHLRQMRNRADYDLDRPLDQPSAIAFVQFAETIVSLSEMAAQDPTMCAQITQAMKTYERDVLGEVTWHP